MTFLLDLFKNCVLCVYVCDQYDEDSTNLQYTMRPTGDDFLLALVGNCVCTTCMKKQEM